MERENYEVMRQQTVVRAASIISGFELSLGSSVQHNVIRIVRAAATIKEVKLVKFS
jgi:hypothetical protein